MPLSRINRNGGRNVDPKAKKIGAIVVAVVALMNTVLPFLINSVRRGLGMMPSVFTVAVIVFAVIFVAALVAGRLKKKHAPWNFAKDSDSELMHMDHYRRTKREHTRHSADPCAYSERYSWRKSQAYDDPWDF